MILTLLPEKNWCVIWQKCMAQRKSNLDNISSFYSHGIIILVSTHMFLRSKNRMKPFLERLGHFYAANSEKIKMAASKNIFMTKSRCLYVKKQIILANIL